MSSSATMFLCVLSVFVFVFLFAGVMALGEKRTLSKKKCPNCGVIGNWTSRSETISIPTTKWYRYDDSIPSGASETGNTRKSGPNSITEREHRVNANKTEIYYKCSKCNYETTTFQLRIESQIHFSEKTEQCRELD